MAKPILHIHQARRLPDTDKWVNRFETISPKSGSTYIISQHPQKRHWACSCRAWTTKRKCKHLEGYGLPNLEMPYEVSMVTVGDLVPLSQSLPQATRQTPQVAPTTSKAPVAPVVTKPKRAISFEDI